MEESEQGAEVIDLADVSAVNVPARCHESLARIKGFIAFTRPDGEDTA